MRETPSEASNGCPLHACSLAIEAPLVAKARKRIRKCEAPDCDAN
jgi:hypothetical protein